MDADYLSTPEKTLDDYKSKKVDKEETIYILKTIIEKNDDVSIRLRSIEALAIMKPGNEEMFKKSI